MTMQTTMIRLMSNEALRHYARFGQSLVPLKMVQRLDAIAARAELDRRDMIVAMGEAA